MGCTMSQDKDFIEQQKRSREIDMRLASEGACRQNEVKLLLLGECAPVSRE